MGWHLIAGVFIGSYASLAAIPASFSGSGEGSPYFLFLPIAPLNGVHFPVNLSRIVPLIAAAALVAIITVLDAGSTDARRGFQKEFEAIIAAVIGGCLLTGGYGSAIGAFLGSIIFGMVLIGLAYTNIDQDWYLVFLGGMLLLAVLFNNFVRKRVTGER